MTTTEQQQKQEMVLPSFFYAIASSESRQLISLDELQRIITLDAMTQARTEDYRKNMRISSELAHQTKVMMPGITTSVLMDGRGKELRNVVKTTQMIAVDIDKIPAEKMKEVVQKADADPHTMMRFITVSQRGLRIISRYLPIDDDEVTALELFDVIIRKAMSYYSKLLGVPADEQCVDITRMCGLAHDPTAYFHWDAEPFGLDTHDLKALYTKKANEAKYAKRASKRKRNSQKMVALGKGVPSMDEAAQHILNLLDTWGYKFESGAHNEYVLHFGKVCVRYGIDKEEAMTYAKSNFSSDYPDADSVMKSCYKHTEKLGTWHFYRKGEGFSGKPTVKVIKQWLSMRYEFHHNEVTGFHEVLSRDIIKGKYHKWTRIDDNIENTIWTQMDEMGLEVSAIKLHAIINSDFSEPWDPFDEYLRSLPKWDGKTDYIDELANRVTINYCPGYHHSQEEFRYFFKKWLVSMVVAWVSPRVVSQTILIFIGRGGINKTTFFYYILPPCLRQYFINESTANYTDKDFMEAFSSKALICLDELESTFGKGLSALKSNVTKLVFSIRRPYDKYRSELLHRGALCGTSNSIQIITDEENRRYSPWFVDNIESPRETPIDYQHVYAQAVALGQEVTNRVKNQEEGWVYWLTTVDIDVMREHNGMFMVSNFMEDQILRFYKVPKSDTDPQYVKFRYSSEIMERIGGSPALSRNMSHQNLSAVMQRLGFKKVHRAKGNGWLVIEKNPGEINSEAICSPYECAETYLKPYRTIATDSQNGSDQQ